MTETRNQEQRLKLLRRFVSDMQERGKALDIMPIARPSGEQELSIHRNAFGQFVATISRRANQCAGEDGKCH